MEKVKKFVIYKLYHVNTGRTWKIKVSNFEEEDVLLNAALNQSHGTNFLTCINVESYRKMIIPSKLLKQMLIERVDDED